MDEEEIDKVMQQAAGLHEQGNLEAAEEICQRVLAAAPEQPDALHLAGLIRFQRGDLQRAVGLLRRAVADSDWPLAQFNLGRALAAQGKPSEAIDAYKEAVRIEDQFPEAHMALGNLWHATGNPAEAAGAFAKVIALQPHSPSAYNNLGTALAALGRIQEAADAFHRAIALNGSYQRAYPNLSNAMLSLLRVDEAIDLARKAVELDPASADAFLSLGHALRAQGKMAEATAAYQRAVELKSDFFEGHISLVQMLTALKHFEPAILHARAAVAARPASVDAYQALAFALEAAGQLEAAKAQYLESIRLDPWNDKARFALAALSGEPPPIAPPQYVAELFDEFAPRFEEHLVVNLEYRIPEQIRDVVESLTPSAALDIIDLGCGTGRCGKLLRPRARSIFGVDLSSKMLEMARRTGAYDRLEHADAEGVLRRPGDFDLIVAADVFVCIGDLSGIFAAAGNALRRGGLFVFTVEAHDGLDYVLQPTRRYAQSIDYLRRLAQANCLDEVSARKVVLRTEAHKPVAGWLVVLRKPSAAQLNTAAPPTTEQSGDR